MIRTSALTVGQYCGASRIHSETAGHGRAAVMSTAYHALCAGDPTPLHSLPPEEAETVRAWRLPTDYTAPDGTVLRFADASKEGTIAIDCWGKACSPDSTDCVTVGHYDFAWIHDDCVYVCDIKKGAYTEPDGPEALQILTYGLGKALAVSALRVQVGIWFATAGRYVWGRPFGVASPKADQILQRIMGALGLPTADEVTGSHCDRCYGRRHCKAWLLPAASLLGRSDLAPPTTPQEALQALRAMQGAKTLTEALKVQLEAWVDEQGPIQDGDGKEWRKTLKETSSRFDMGRFRQDHPDLLEQYTTDHGPGSMGYRWGKVR